MSEESARPQPANPYLVPASIVLGAVIVGLFLMIGLSNRGGAAADGTGIQKAAAASTVDIGDVKISGEPYIGRVDAPVTMAYWSDYQCPFCKSFEVGGVPQINGTMPAAMPSLLRQYVEKGKLKIVFKDFQFLGNDSTTGAEYARAIWDLYPNDWYDWRVAMYEAQDEEGDRGFGNAASIDELIKRSFPRMDDAKIKQRIAEGKNAYDAAIAADRAEGQKFGITGTPAFIVGTTLIPGAAPLKSFTDVIDPQLK